MTKQSADTRIIANPKPRFYALAGEAISCISSVLGVGDCFTSFAMTGKYEIAPIQHHNPTLHILHIPLRTVQLRTV
ncbi:MAG: hypothetical protein M3342_15900 [Bacteroidota bacterium]|nr:hypothetical protein [Bacteroidota bacterium]